MQPALCDMTAAQKRVAIAEDVLKHIKLFVTMSGTYYDHSVESYKLACKAIGDENAQPHIDKLSNGCEVCALGACMLSYVRLFDNVPLAMFKHMSDDYMRERMQDIFGYKTLKDIEAYFEGFKGFDCIGSKAFRRKFPSHEERLQRIMQNIIDGKGTFNEYKLIFDADITSKDLLVL